jgi:small subunit ribosomal protein S5
MISKEESKETKQEKQAEELREKEMEKKDQTSKEQLSEMAKIVEKKEEAEDKKVSVEADKQFKKEERRTEFKRESREERYAREAREKLGSWVPRTELGKLVKSGKIKSMDEVFKRSQKILEPEIVETLIPNLIVDTLFIGQAKGKFGGGKRRAFRQTQKKTKEGNVLTFGVMAVAGDGNGCVGIGYGRASETLPAKEKAIRKAKLNIVRIKRGCGSYDCSCEEEHSVPFSVQGKCSSSVVKLIPAPQGTGLVIGDEMKKILRAVGIRDVYGKCSGKVKTTFNTGKACMQALTKIGDLLI